MPGITGFVGSRLYGDKNLEYLKKMQEYLTHCEFYVQDELFNDESVCATRCHNNTINKEPQPFKSEGLYIWLDGEFYNSKDLLSKPEYPNLTDIEVLSKLYKEDASLGFLEKIDGVFSAVIYDLENKKLHIISDRYGLRHLYWAFNGDILVWSSEVKAFMAIPWFKPEIDKSLIKEFLNIGYILENRTWFNGVELLDSGTVMTYDMKGKNTNSKRYWWWDRIKPISVSISENEVIDEFGRLFNEAVIKRSQGEEAIGITLSGGLDSRAILAAMPKKRDPIHALTFGEEGCLDIQIASEVIKVRGAIHHTSEINSDNWLDKRFEGVWWTDGQENIMHMHGIECLSYLKNLYDINMDGAGSPIIGGTYMLQDKRCLDSPANSVALARAMGCSPGDLDKSVDNFKALPKTDYYFLQNRGRRFVNEGIRHASVYLQHRLPFFDNNIVEFAYSLPDSVRYQNNVYFKMLLKNYPEYYQNISWQDINIPICYPFLISELLQTFFKIKRKLAWKVPRIGFNYPRLNNYTNYPQWIKQLPASKIIRKLLFSKDALYREFVPIQDVKDDWNMHIRGIDRAEKLCLYVTLELWLQQVYNGKYRGALPTPQLRSSPCEGDC